MSGQNAILTETEALILIGHHGDLFIERTSDGLQAPCWAARLARAERVALLHGETDANWDGLWQVMFACEDDMQAEHLLPRHAPSFGVCLDRCEGRLLSRAA